VGRHSTSAPAQVGRTTICYRSAAISACEKGWRIAVGVLPSAVGLLNTMAVTKVERHTISYQAPSVRASRAQLTQSVGMLSTLATSGVERDTISYGVMQSMRSWERRLPVGLLCTMALVQVGWTTIRCRKTAISACERGWRIAVGTPISYSAAISACMMGRRGQAWLLAVGLHSTMAPSRGGQT
jgi:hypothetical protein